MTGPTRIGAVLIHPRGDHMGNLLWPGVLPADQATALAVSIAAVTAQGYWASPFPEGDGVTFKRSGESSHDAAACLTDFQAAFVFLEIEELDPAEGQASALARLAAGRTIMCTYLVPVEALRLERPFLLGDTRFHAPVDGRKFGSPIMPGSRCATCRAPTWTQAGYRAHERQGRLSCSAIR